MSKKCHLFSNVPIGELGVLMEEKVVDGSEDARRIESEKYLMELARRIEDNVDIFASSPSSTTSVGVLQWEAFLVSHRRPRQTQALARFPLALPCKFLNISELPVEQNDLASWNQNSKELRRLSNN